MKHFEQAIANALHEAERAILQLVELEEPVWSNIFCIEGGKSNKPFSVGRIRATGVYKIYHKDDLTTPVVIGEGSVGTRKGRHVTVMRNGGKSKTHENGSSSPCSTATKMYKYDSNLTRGDPLPMRKVDICATFSTKFLKTSDARIEQVRSCLGHAFCQCVHGTIWRHDSK